MKKGEQSDVVKGWCGSCKRVSFGQSADLEGLLNTCPESRKGRLFVDCDFKTNCKKWESREEEGEE